MPLYIVRHGETDWNREKRFQSRTDVPLNARGSAQAWALRDELRHRNVHFASARTSPLSRAVDTARIILNGTDTPLVVEPAFIELSLGEFEGRREEDLREQLGEAFSAWRAMEYTQAPPGGESILDGTEKVRGPLLALKQAARLGNVLVVAHQAVNMAMKVALTGRTDLASAALFRQNNDEVDVWDMESGERLERLRIPLTVPGTGGGAPPSG